MSAYPKPHPLLKDLVCNIPGCGSYVDNKSEFLNQEIHDMKEARLHAYLLHGKAADEIVRINNLQPDTPKQAQFRDLIRSLLDAGIKPTPTEILKRQGDNKYVIPTKQQAASYSGPCFHGGDLTRIRREEFIRAGYQVQPNGRWELPTG